MKNLYHNRIHLNICRATAISALLLFPLASQAQAFFGGGGNTNTATTATNVGLGFNSLAFLTTGSSNVAIGMQALYKNTTGFNNTALGYQALNYNTTGTLNVSIGFQSLFFNTTGSANVASGLNALAFNTTGSFNTATGYQALFSNTVANYNVAEGFNALYSNTGGIANTAGGAYALQANTNGTNNTANGYFSLYNNTLGSNNTAHGLAALKSNTTGSNNTALGFKAGYNITTGSNNISIGHQGLAADSGAIRIGTIGTQTSAFMAGINGVTVSGGIPVYINANGQLGTVLSSRRFKNEIKTMGTVSDKLMQLRPVTFKYNDVAEKGTHALQYGLIAEEVAKVYPDLVQYDKLGKPFTVYYHLLTPMLLNEVKKEHAKIATLEAKLIAMEKAQAEQQKLLVKLTAYLQNNKTPLQPANYIQH